MNTLLHWLPAISAVCLLFGSALMLWGFKVVPVSNPFTLPPRSPSRHARGPTGLARPPRKRTYGRGGISDRLALPGMPKAAPHGPADGLLARLPREAVAPGPCGTRGSGRRSRP